MFARALVDTSALLALAVPREQHHKKALAVLTRFRERGGQFVGTLLVLAELHRLMLARQGIEAARRVLAALLDDPVFAWWDLSLDEVQQAQSDWLQRFSDQRFSLTDAVSFELMRRERITQAFAFDQHFVTAGFDLLK